MPPLDSVPVMVAVAVAVPVPQVWLHGLRLHDSWQLSALFPQYGAQVVYMKLRSLGRSQAFPPYSACAYICLSLYLTPRPHVTLQSDQGLQMYMQSETSSNCSLIIGHSAAFPWLLPLKRIYHICVVLFPCDVAVKSANRIAWV